MVKRVEGMVIEEDRAAKERKPDAFIRSVQPSLDHQAGTSGHFETNEDV